MPALNSDKRSSNWTPDTSVSRRVFSPELIKFSNDRERFFFVYYSGARSCDCLKFELTVYSVREVRAALEAGTLRSIAPISHLQRISSINHLAAIAGAEWTRSGKAIRFRGPDREGLLQSFEFDVESGAVKQLTSWNVDGSNSSIVENTKILDARNDYVEQIAKFAYPMQAVTRRELYWALHIGTRGERNTFLAYGNGRPWKVEGSGPGGMAGQMKFPIEISKDGEQIAAIRYPSAIPPSWSRYSRIADGSYVDEFISGQLSQFIHIVPRTKDVEPFLDAPIGVFTRSGFEAYKRGLYPSALFLRDQRHVLLVNTAVPVDPAKIRDFSDMAYIVLFDCYTGKWTVVAPLEKVDSATGAELVAKKVSRSSDGNGIRIEYASSKGKDVSETYELFGTKLEKVDDDLPMQGHPSGDVEILANSDLRVTIEQSQNEPPMVVARLGGNQLNLTGADPALAHVWVAKSRTIRWKSENGTLNSGGLILPRTSESCVDVGVAGEPERAEYARDDRCGPVPLVVQIYSYDPKQFDPDGPARHAYAGQALASKGIAVLTINLSDQRGIGELSETSSRVRGAIQYLAHRDLIDPNNVGVIGFSRAGYNVYYGITHPDEMPVRAAIIDDSYPGTYTYYLQTAAIKAIDRKEFDDTYGGSFWNAKKVWLEREPSFNVDRIRAPVMMAVHGTTGLVWAADQIGSFMLNRKALEYIIFPEGGHYLGRPLERIASQNATIEWMSFWLLGKMPDDSERSIRWIRMKKEWERQQAWEAAGHPPGSEPDKNFVVLSTK